MILSLLLNSTLLTGNKLAIAAFIHPSLSRQDHRVNLSAIQRFAHLYGGVMPIWMAVTTALHIFVFVMVWFYSPSAFPWLCAAALIWALRSDNTSMA